MKLYKFALAPFLFLAVACGGDGSSVSIVGGEPADQAATVADAICDAQVSCGKASFETSFDEETQMIVCTATIEDVDHAECVADIEPDALDTFENCDLTAEEEQTIEDCINAQLALPCLTQTQLDDYCTAVEAGEEPEFPQEIPAVCEEMQAIIEACDAPA